VLARAPELPVHALAAGDDAPAPPRLMTPS
jgi:hypothetical protein